MTATLNKCIVRMKLDTLSFDSPRDVIRQDSIRFWRCNDLEFQIGIFRGEEWADISNFASIHFAVKSMEGSYPPEGSEVAGMLKSTTELNSELTLETWLQGSQQHATVSFSARENTLPSGEYWLTVWAETNSSETITLGSGVCTILENGGIDFVPPEPIENYYTGKECDEKFLSRSALDNYYTSQEIDQNFATKSTLEAYYTSSECDNKFALKGTGGAGGYPLLAEKILDAGTDEVILRDVFQSALYKKYKVSFDFLKMSEKTGRLQLQLGYTENDEVLWITSASDYNFNTEDFLGSSIRSGSYVGTGAFFALGNTNSNYRYYDSELFGEIDLWNNGDVQSSVQGLATLSYIRLASGSITNGSGLYSMFFKNSVQKIISSLRIYPDTGTLTGGRIRVYGIS